MPRRPDGRQSCNLNNPEIATISQPAISAVPPMGAA
jgi:hypothetical protein